jgi:hypothetical protein
MMPRREHIAGWKVVAFASPILAVIFPLIHGWSVGFEPRSMFLLAAAGAAIGVIAAPLFEPAAFRHPLMWQVFFSVLCCVFIAIQQQAGKLGFAIALVGGVVLGLTAKWWVDSI